MGGSLIIVEKKLKTLFLKGSVPYSIQLFRVKNNKMNISKLGKYKNDNVAEFDEFLYNELHILIKTKSNKLADYLPEFIIYEAIVFFLEKDLFHKHDVLKDYLILNPEKIIKINRKDWLDYGWRDNLRKTNKKFGN